MSVPADPIRVLLVEDHAFTRDGLRATLGLEPDLRVVAEARSGEEALELLARVTVDVAVLDIGLPGMDGVELVRHVRRLRPALPVLVVSGHIGSRGYGPGLEHLPADVEVLRKPFRREEFIGKVSEGFRRIYDE